jgi:hypothetical protein
VDASQSVLELMAKISNMVPSGCNISRFDFRRDRLSIEGRAQSGAIAARFAEVIREAAVDEFAALADASMTNTTPMQEQRTTVFQYTIDVPLLVPDEDDGEGSAP